MRLLVRDGVMDATRSIAAVVAWLVAAAPTASAQDQLWSVRPTFPANVFAPDVLPFRDFDGDGVLDVWVNEENLTWRVLSGATGQLLHAPHASLNAYHFRGAFDWSGDGVDDYLCTRRPASPVGEVRDGATGKQLFVTHSDRPIVARDVDGDGKPELAGFGAPGQVVLSRGSNGSVLWTATVPALGAALLVVDDWNGDGVDEFACTSAAPPVGQGSIVLLSLGNGSLVASGGPTVTGATSLTTLARDVDRDGDGRDDWIVANPLEGGGPLARGAAWLVSSASFATLRRIDGRIGAELAFECVAGDLDGDGVTDLAFQYALPYEPNSPVIEVTSGRTWRPLVWFESNAPTPYPPELAAARIGDADGDGCDDLAIGRATDHEVTCDRGRELFLSLHPNSKPMPPPMNGQRDAVGDYAFGLFATGFQPWSLVLVEWVEHAGAAYGPVTLLIARANGWGELSDDVLLPPLPNTTRPEVFGLQISGVARSGTFLTTKVERCLYY
jgi:hypothetical protein